MDNTAKKKFVHIKIDIHAKNKWGYTALQWAKENGYQDIVTYLAQEAQYK